MNSYKYPPKYHENKRKLPRDFSSAHRRQITYKDVSELSQELLLFLTTSHSIFQSQLSVDCDLVLPHSISSILSSPLRQPAAAYFLFLVFTSLLSFPLSFSHSRVLDGSSYAVCDQSSQPSFNLLYLVYSRSP